MLTNLVLQVLRLARISIDLKVTRVCLFVLIVQIALPLVSSLIIVRARYVAYVVAIDVELVISMFIYFCV